MLRSLALLTSAALGAASTSTSAGKCTPGQCDTSQALAAQDEGAQGGVGLLQLSSGKAARQSSRGVGNDRKAPEEEAATKMKHVAYVACGGSYFDLNAQLSLQSLLGQMKLDRLHSMQSGGPPIKLTVHIVLDKESKVSFDEWQDLDNAYWRPVSDFKVYMVDDIMADQPQMKALWQRFIDLDPDRRCASVDLFFPYFIHDVEEMLYLDADTRIVGSPEQLFEPLPAPLVWGMAEDAGENFRVPAYTVKSCRGAGYPGKCFYGKRGLNSGVITFHLDRYRDANVIEESERWLEMVEKGELMHSFGDQDVMNWVAESHKKSNWTTILPCAVNIRPWMGLPMTHMGPDVCSFRNIKKPVLLHGTAHAFHELPGWKAVARSVEEAVERVRQLPWEGSAGAEREAVPESLCEWSDCMNFWRA